MSLAGEKRGSFRLKQQFLVSAKSGVKIFCDIKLLFISYLFPQKKKKKNYCPHNTPICESNNLM